MIKPYKPRVGSIVWFLSILEVGQSHLFELEPDEDMQKKQSEMQTYIKRLAPMRFAQSSVIGTENQNLNNISVVRIIRVTRFE